MPKNLGIWDYIHERVIEQPQLEFQPQQAADRLIDPIFGQPPRFHQFNHMFRAAFTAN